MGSYGVSRFGAAKGSIHGVMAVAVVGVVLAGCSGESADSSSSASPPATSSASAPAAVTASATASGSEAPDEIDPASGGAALGEVAPVDATDTAPVPGTGPAAPSRELIPELAVNGGSPPVGDACALVQIPESLGAGAAPGEAMNQGSSELSLSSCAWGSGDTESMLILYVIRPGAVADPGAYFIPQQAPASLAAPQPPGGRMWEAGFYGLGGATVEGRTYAWSSGSNQVVLTFMGEVTPQRAAELEQLVRQVDASLV